MRVKKVEFTAYRRSWDALFPRDAHFSLGTLVEERKKSRLISYYHSVLLSVAQVPATTIIAHSNIFPKL